MVQEILKVLIALALLIVLIRLVFKFSKFKGGNVQLVIDFFNILNKKDRKKTKIKKVHKKFTII